MALAVTVDPADASEDASHDHGADEIEEITVQATRSRRRLQDEPIPVEVINQEEIEEKLLMRPGNMPMLLAETGGLRVQVTSPGLGSANIRVQGMRGRYTQLLADGLPLYGGQALGGSTLSATGDVRRCVPLKQPLASIMAKNSEPNDDG